MKNIKYSIVFLLTIALCFTACLDEIILDESIDLEENVAIQGSLIKGTPSRVDVFVSKLSNLTGVNLPKAILDAEVSILDENGMELLLDNINSGFYELDIPASSAFVVDVNRKYQLKVKTQTNEYVSAMESLLPVPKISGLDIRPFDSEVPNGAGSVEIRRNIELSVSTPVVTPNSNSKSQLLWELVGTYKFTDTPEINCRPTANFPDPKACYVTEKINLDKVVVFDGTKVSTNDIQQFSVFEGRVNFRFAEGYYMTFLQRSLTQGAYDYWKSTNDMLQRSGSFFEAPAGKIESNFTSTNNTEEEVFGYFYATQQDTARIYIDPVVADSPVLYCPSEVDPLSPPDQCCNCLDQEGSTDIKPEWWQ